MKREYHQTKLQYIPLAKRSFAKEFKTYILGVWMYNSYLDANFFAHIINNKESEDVNAEEGCNQYNVCFINIVVFMYEQNIKNSTEW